MKPLEITVSRLPFGAGAITLWPFILYLPHAYADPCIRAHEHYHWRQALRWGVVLWYVTYLVLKPFYMGRPAEEHPLERPAYAVERKCRAGAPGQGTSQ